jgi:hypothetical protein
VEPEIRLFGWPPPRPSAKAKIPREMLVKKEGRTRVGDVADRLDNAFAKAGYGERSWYAVPGGGFALASRLEQFNEDCTPKGDDERWLVALEPPRVFGLKDVFRVLFNAQVGHYRIIVFVVTPQVYSLNDKPVSRDEAIKWVEKGADKLPEEIRQPEYSRAHVCQALIYEFEQESRSQPADFKDPSKWQGETHLRKAKIWSALGG